jgi:hypothetical protein
MVFSTNSYSKILLEFFENIVWNACAMIILFMFDGNVCSIRFQKSFFLYASVREMNDDE